MTYSIVQTACCSTSSYTQSVNPKLLKGNEKLALITDLALAALLVAAGTFVILQVTGTVHFGALSSALTAMGSKVGYSLISVGGTILILDAIKLIIQKIRQTNETLKRRQSQPPASSTKTPASSRRHTSSDTPPPSSGSGQRLRNKRETRHAPTSARPISITHTAPPPAERNGHDVLGGSDTFTGVYDLSSSATHTPPPTETRETHDEQGGSGTHADAPRPMGSSPSTSTAARMTEGEDAVHDGGALRDFEHPLPPRSETEELPDLPPRPASGSSSPFPTPSGERNEEHSGLSGRVSDLTTTTTSSGPPDVPKAPDPSLSSPPVPKVETKGETTTASAPPAEHRRGMADIRFQLQEATLLLGKTASGLKPPSMNAFQRKHMLKLLDMPRSRSNVKSAALAFEMYLEEKIDRLGEAKPVGEAVQHDIASSYHALFGENDLQDSLFGEMPELSGTDMTQSFMPVLARECDLDAIDGNLLAYFAELYDWIKEEKDPAEAIERVKAAQIQLGKDVMDVLNAYSQKAAEDKARSNAARLEADRARRLEQREAFSRLQTRTIEQACVYQVSDSDLYDLKTLNFEGLSSVQRGQIFSVLSKSEPYSGMTSQEAVIGHLEGLKDALSEKSAALREKDLTEDQSEGITELDRVAEDLTSALQKIANCRFIKTGSMDLLLKRTGSV